MLIPKTGKKRKGTDVKKVPKEAEKASERTVDSEKPTGGAGLSPIGELGG